MALFGIPFLLAGLFVLSLGVKGLFISAERADWETANAQVTELSADKEELSATLAYEWDGQRYTTSNIKAQEMTEEGWEEDTRRQLKSAHKKGRPVPIILNPDSPSEAVLKSDEGAFMLFFPIGFGAIFALVGGGIIAGGIFAIRKSRRTSGMMKKDPERQTACRGAGRSDHGLEGSTRRCRRTEHRPRSGSTDA